VPQAQTPPAGKANFGERTSTHLGEQGLKGIIVLSSERASLKADMSATKTLRVMLVEDHLAFRQSLAFLLMRGPTSRWWPRLARSPKPERCSTLAWTLRCSTLPYPTGTGGI
jgi:hypothetical protein